jgi:hypothetical protein
MIIVNSSKMLKENIQKMTKKLIQKDPLQKNIGFKCLFIKAF